MKKLALVLAVLLVATFSAPAFASDFSTGGQYRTRAFQKDPGGGAETQYYIDQRFRLAFNWAVNDNVSAQLRGDFTEHTWGDGYRPAAGTNTIMLDKAYVKIAQGPLTLMVGQQGGAFGLGTLWNDQFTGIQATVALDPVTVKLLYDKGSENGANTDSGANDDDNTYGVSVLFANDAVSGGVSYATSRFEDVDDNRTGFSVHAVAPLGNFKVSGEAVFFSGDDGAGTDYAGTQAHVVLGGTLSETLSANVTLLWAADVDSDETQLTNVAHDYMFHPVDFSGGLGWDGLFTGVQTGIFDVAGGGNGVLGILGDIKVVATEAISLYAKLGYAEPNANATLDNKLYAIASVDYAWMPAVTLSAGVGYIAPSYSDSTNDDALVTGALKLAVSF